MTAPMRCRTRPCPECPWVRSTAPGQFSRERYDALAATSGMPGDEAPIGSGLFACHMTVEGSEVPCAGWLASVGYESIPVRLLLATGRIPASVMDAAPDWPELFGSYEEMANAMANTGERR